jgi:hypothetical protein
MLEMEAKRRGISVTTLRMCLAVPDSLMRDIVRDHVRGVSPRSMAGVSGQVVAVRRDGPPGGGYAAPLRTPHIAGVDAVAEGFAKRDAAERAAEMAELKRKLGAQAEPPQPFEPNAEQGPEVEGKPAAPSVWRRRRV